VTGYPGGSSRPPGRGVTEREPRGAARPPGRSALPLNGWWQGMGFWHGAVLGASTMALLVGFIALATWFSSTIDRSVPPENFGVTETDEQPSGSKTSSDPSPNPVPGSLGGSDYDSAEYANLAAQVAVVPTSSGTQRDYDRALFGQSWADVDRNGCDTRNDILRRDLIDPVFEAGTSDCKVLSGDLIDPFSGSPMAFVSGRTTSIEVQIDHLVPLAWAWRNGASEWTGERRVEFANDPLNLLAVNGGLNQEKSDSGPSEWLPPNRAFQCEYLFLFASVVVEYDLALPAPDRTVLMELLRTC
jgi:hypothetical protein